MYNSYVSAINKNRMNSISSTKGYYGIVKGIVMSTDDPKQKKRVQVHIPCIHGMLKDNWSDVLPWAQVAGARTTAANNDSSSVQSEYLNIFGVNNSQASTTSNGGMPITQDVVWIMFEGGDINYPVVIGISSISIGETESASATASSSTVSGNYDGSVLSLGRNIIYMVESGGNVFGQCDYGCMVPAHAVSAEETAITIGAGQWMGTEAKTLMEKIYQADQNTFTKIDTAGIYSDMQSSNWANYNIPKGSAKWNCIKSIITTEVGKKCQDQLMEEQVSQYMSEAQSKAGITDLGAQMEFMNVKHQAGESTAMAVAKAAGGASATVDSMYNAIMARNGTNQVGSYKDRQNAVYKAIKDHESDLKSGTNSTTTANNDLTKSPTSAPNIDKITLSQRLERDLYNFMKCPEPKFPFPSVCYKYIEKYYGYERNPVTQKDVFHNGIDICHEMIDSTPVLAVFDGVVTLKKNLNPINGYGLRIILTSKDNKNVVAIYDHLCEFLVEDGQEVSMSQNIGLIGNTGNSYRSHLHFSLRINGGYQNPLPYLSI